MRAQASTVLLATFMIASVAVVTRAPAQEPLSSGFTYQGYLKRAGSAVNTTADFEFTMLDAASGGAVVASTVAVDDVLVAGGTFTVQLDFGVVAFNGDARWLEIAVRSPHDPADTEPFTTLDPRQPITATPYALQTRGLLVDEDSNVGVGTTSPAAPLHIERELGDTVLLLSGTGGTQYDQRIQFKDTGSDWFLGNRWTADLNGFGIGRTSTKDDFVIDSSGNVGIGTTSPAQRLQVAGNIVASGAIRSSSFEVPRTGEIRMEAPDLAYPWTGPVLFSGSDLGAGYHDAYMYWRNNSIRFRGGSQDWTPFHFDMESGDLYVPNGNVGIGTSAPEQRLDVNGHIKLGLRSKIFWQGDGVAGHQGALGIYGIENGRYTVITPHDGNGDLLQDSTIRFGGQGLFDNAHVDLEVSGMVKAEGIIFPDGTVQTTAANGSANCVYDGVTYSPGTTCRSGGQGCCNPPYCGVQEGINLTCQPDGTWSTSTSCSEVYQDCGL